MIALAGGGLITLEAGIALALGANLGTCVTAALAAIGKPVEARRAAGLHIVFNLVGVGLWIGFIPALATLAATVSPSFPALDGLARLAAETPRQIANANTIFNLVNTVVMIGFASALAELVSRLVRPRPSELRPVVAPRHLNPAFLALPSAALDAARREMGEIGRILTRMGETITEAGRQRSVRLLREARAKDDGIDTLHAALMRYLSDLPRQSLSEGESAGLRSVLIAANDLEAMGDLLGEELTVLIERCIVSGRTETPAARLILDRPFTTTMTMVAHAAQAVAESNQTLAAEVHALEATATVLVASAFAEQAEHLGEIGAESLETLRWEIELVNIMRRIATQAAHCAGSVMILTEANQA